MCHFNIYTLLHSNDMALVNTINDEEYGVVAGNPVLAWISWIVPEAQWQIEGPCPCHNYFASGLLLDDTQTALHVTHHPNHDMHLLESVGTYYHLPDFELQYQKFLNSHIQDPQILCAFNHFAIWEKFCIQLLSTIHPSLILPSQVVQAKPPAEDFPLGCCNMVLVGHGEDSTS